MEAVMEKTEALPKGWKVVQLGDVLEDVVGGGTPSRNVERYWNGDIPWITVKDMRTRRPEQIQEHITQAGVDECATNIIPADTVITATRVGLGKVVRVPYPAAINQDLKALIVGPDLDKSYLEWWIIANADYIDSIGSGTTVKGIRLNQLRELKLPLGPLPQQRRIVEAIELQLGRLDAAVARLHAAKARLKRYKQAVLKAAVEGRLTEEWREKNPDIEPATKLIERLAVLRRAEWERQKKAGERRSMLQSESAEEQVQIEIDLPDTWTWATPEEIASAEPYSIGIGPFGSNLKVSDYTDAGVPLIFIRHITSENFDLGLKYTSERKYKELIAHVAKPLDVLVAKMGDPPGDATIYPADRPPGVMTADCIKLRVWDPLISRQYVMHCIRSYVVKQQLGLITMGVAQKKISTGRFKTLLFPMPPMEEQYAIADILADRFERCRVTEKMIDAQLEQSTRLRQAVLKRAFEGRLV
jgi:type I restriction enzyme S subunit